MSNALLNMKNVHGFQCMILEV